MAPRFHVEIYPAPTGTFWWKRGPRQLRFRAVASGNNEILATGESYHNRADLLDTVHTLFGPDVPVKDVAE